MISAPVKQIGIDRFIKLEWLETTAALALENRSAVEVKAIIRDSLKNSFRTETIDARSSIDKTITVLMKIWISPNSEILPFRERSLAMLKESSPRSYGQISMPIQWGMISAAYPFWSAVAVQVGRLLNLQGNVTLSQIQRRMCEQYGERQTVSRSTQRIVRSFVDWQVLKETDRKGVYTFADVRYIENDRLIARLLETFIFAKADHSAPLKELLNSPGLFPFRLKNITTDNLVREAPALYIIRHDMDNDLVKMNEHK